MLAQWGRFVHAHPRRILLASVLLLAASAMVLAQGGNLQQYAPPSHAESSRALDLFEAQLAAEAGESFSLVFSSPTLTASDPAFRSAVHDALQSLVADPRVNDVRTPWTVPAQESADLRSRDGHHVLAIVALKDPYAEAFQYYPELRALVHSDALDIRATSGMAINQAFEATLAADLQRAEIVGLPPTFLLLVLVFGTAVAAFLPLGVGLLAVATGLAGVLALSRVTDVSIYAMNVTTLIGLGVAIDYSLFIVSRYREELAAGRTPAEALPRTLATAGRATLFSGITVAIGLAGLLFYNGTYFASMGLAGAIVVALAVVYALTFLPAVLALLGTRVNAWRVPFAPKPAAAGTPDSQRGFWRALSLSVMKRPLPYLGVALVVLLVAGAPFLKLQVTGASVEQLPEDAEARQGHQILADNFDGRGTASYFIVAHAPGKDPLAAAQVRALYDLSRDLAAVPGVVRVESIVDADPRIGKEDYVRMFAGDRDALPAPMQAAVERSVGDDIVTLLVRGAHPIGSEESRALVRDIRATVAYDAGAMLVSGQAAFDEDTISFVAERTPYAVAFVIIVTYLLILLQTGSIVLPAKAILMNLLSITATFGALVWIFQEGNLSGVLDFTPGAIDVSVPVLLFCIVFGLSMDYEVFLLSRMHEEYAKHGDNTRAVADGLQKSGRLITGAAAIMIVVFGAFGLADVVVIKATGLGLAIAIFADATLVRAIVVPASMRLMGRWNWWSPGPLKRLADVFGERMLEDGPAGGSGAVREGP